MANMNNEIFPVLRKNQYLAVLRNFFADVSKKRKTRYLKNGCINFLDFFTDTSYNKLLLNRLKDKQLKHYSLSFAKKFKNYFFGENAWSAKNLSKFEFSLYSLSFSLFNSYLL